MRERFSRQVQGGAGARRGRRGRGARRGLCPVQPLVGSARCNVREEPAGHSYRDGSRESRRAFCEAAADVSGAAGRSRPALPAAGPAA
jgi:hypothetical protein